MKRITPIRRELGKIKQIDKTEYARHKTFDTLTVTFKHGKALTFIPRDTIHSVRLAIPLEFQLSNMTVHKDLSLSMMYVREKA